VPAKTHGQQAMALAALALTTDVTVKRGRVRWHGCLQPTALSASYKLRIDYKPPTRPLVSVLSPALEPPEEDDLPHVFDGGHLCLCYPWQWDGSQLIATTIVPWASEWLLHYELWKITGRWHGGGHEPPACGKLETSAEATPRPTEIEPVVQAAQSQSS
jgi:hypothetical protein